ncbi:MAG: hypothetical protein DWQ31_21435 [Planctomycetota bacterium]|nr:MAG: hypothetical protein DWQ31_21435 [Planctomycetota bacterium]REJ93668.1 MAG: hypothetical protein DWQ35_09970 [Planctomycetota bacterium]REK25717.1 MAG: hypothetical protein DWQ42_10710 [Planctomycetota bacterium]REK46537.1 MAG: hypothetical protein DWQ46_06595 [Planctomycetota bacterium]
MFATCARESLGLQFRQFRSQSSVLSIISDRRGLLPWSIACRVGVANLLADATATPSQAWLIAANVELQ